MSTSTAASGDQEPEESSNERNPGGRSAAEQNSVIPLGWKATKSEPLPVVRCVQIKKDGERCNRWSLRGYTKCFVHSGRGGLNNVQEYAQQVVEAARLRLIDDADGALDVLNELTQPGTGEAIRLKAATEILDRAGIRGGFEIKVEGEITASPVDELRKRLDGLKAGADAVNKMKAASQQDIVDAEIVDEDDDQLSLFDVDDEEQD